MNPADKNGDKLRPALFHAHAHCICSKSALALDKLTMLIHIELGAVSCKTNAQTHRHS